MLRSDPPKVFVQSAGDSSAGGSWLEFGDPVEILVAREIEDVRPTVEAVERATIDNELYAAGFLCYEAAPAFDSVFETLRPSSPLPLAWFGLYSEPLRRRSLPETAGRFSVSGSWDPSVDLEEYGRAVDEIRMAIARGDTYQANYTFRMFNDYRGDPFALFSRLLEAQPVAHAAYFDIGEHVICSASPELFFQLDGRRILCRPMKGTSPRGLTSKQDRRLALELYNSPKNRAENLMIVDMVRNDLGRIAEPGSVEVRELFNLERYASVFQLTSEIEATTDRPLSEILAALFPCASITGAPKVRTMEILSSLESTPRGIYTGTMGFLGPGRKARFNVAIRTVHLQRSSGRASYGTGGGVVWDSRAEEEYSECAVKSSVLTLERPSFELFETLRWDPETGYLLRQRHLDRLSESAEFFGFSFDRSSAARLLHETAMSFGRSPRRVRLALRRSGAMAINTRDRLQGQVRPWRLALAPAPVNATDVFLYHKTTHREVYRAARAAAPRHDDTLLWNESGLLTESTIANLVVESEGRRFTPPVEDGLLDGTYRAELIDSGKIEVRSLDIDGLRLAERVWLLNSVRGWLAVGRIDDLRPGRNGALWRNPDEDSA